MPTVEASGTQAAVIGTEHVLNTVATPGVYIFVVDTNAMAAGDTLELRIYLKTLAGSVSRVAYMVSYKDAQPVDDIIKVSIPAPAMHELRATLKQTAGVGRNYDWEIISV